uniref:Class I SAM-dependent methyltransferase n=1 Tax=Acidobacterium capsulatum TaxID=33075 RepID=A0A7V4XVS1_9BACT
MNQESAQSQRLKVFRTLFAGYDGPPFCVRLWDGWFWHSPGADRPVCTIVFNSSDAFRTLIAHPSEVTLGEAFIEKQIDVEGDIFSVFTIAEHIFRCPKGRRRQILEIVSGMMFGLGQWWTEGKRHSAKRDQKAISYHYDQPAEFYQPWLGESLVYSCAYFQSPLDDVDTAQRNKLDLICRKLRLEPCQRFLDIGCGWGSLIMHAASKYNVYAHGITLSHEQAQVAAARIERARLAQSCRVNLMDYRKAPQEFDIFDRIASIGMFEHVGLKNLPIYFNTAYRLLKPGGVFLNHGIARAQAVAKPNASLLDRIVVPFLRDVLLLRPPRNATFIGKYVFPDGELATISQASRAAEMAGFEIRDVDNLREHYALTLRCWVERLRANADTLLSIVPESTYRVWLLYMAGSAAAFRRGDIAVYQTLLSRPENGNSHLPLTREDWYQSSSVIREQHVKA